MRWVFFFDTGELPDGSLDLVFVGIKLCFHLCPFHKFCGTYDLGTQSLE
jgi:hypothetical protein